MTERILLGVVKILKDKKTVQVLGEGVWLEEKVGGGSGTCQNWTVFVGQRKVL